MLSIWTVQESDEEMRARAFPDSSQVKMVINKAWGSLSEHTVLDICTQALCSRQPAKGLSTDLFLHPAWRETVL